MTLPPTDTDWRIENVTEIVTFALVDVSSLDVAWPDGTTPLPARLVEMPPVAEHVAANPEVADWLFTAVEITRQDVFSIDGRTPTLGDDNAIGLWFAPVDPSGIGAPALDVVAQSAGAVVVLDTWLADAEFVDFMNERGHPASIGSARLEEDGDALVGSLDLADLSVAVTATPLAPPEVEEVSGMQVMIPLGATIDRVIAAIGSNPAHAPCAATWNTDGSHPLGNAVFVDVTMMTVYDEPLTGGVVRV